MNRLKTNTGKATCTIWVVTLFATVVLALLVSQFIGSEQNKNYVPPVIVITGAESTIQPLCVTVIHIEDNGYDIDDKVTVQFGTETYVFWTSVPLEVWDNITIEVELFPVYLYYNGLSKKPTVVWDLDRWNTGTITLINRMK